MAHLLAVSPKHEVLLLTQADEQARILEWLEGLRVEHNDLDVVINHLMEARHHDSMRIQRLKRRKLKIKDMIHRLESELIPDLDA